MPVVATVTRFAFRSDTLAVNDASFVFPAGENTAWVPTPIQCGVPFRIRFKCTNTGSTAVSSAWRVWVSRNGGAYAQVTTSTTYVQSSSAASTDSDEASLSTRRLTQDATAFNNGVYDETGTTGTVALPIGNVTSQEIEFEFGLVITSSAALGDTYDFHLYRGTSTTITHTYTPRVTITQAVFLAGAAGAGLTAGSPTFDTVPAFGASTPPIDLPAADALTTTGPVLGTPLIAIGGGLAADALTTTGPVLGTPIITSSGGLSANALALQSPTLPTPALGYTPVLVAATLATGSPTLSATPAFTAFSATVLTASDIAVSSPVLGGSLLGQNHHITATALTVSSPALPTPILVRGLALPIAANLTVQSPVIPQPSLSLKAGLTAQNFACGPPAFGTPALGQNRHIAASEATISSPIFGTAVFAQEGVWLADDLTIQSPQIGNLNLVPASIGQFETIVNATISSGKLIESAGGNLTHYVKHTSGGMVPTTRMTFWAELKAAERNWALITLGDNFGGFVNISGKAFGTNYLYGSYSHNVVDLGSGWARFEWVADVSAILPFLRISLSNGDNAEAYAGDGSSGIYVNRVGIAFGNAVDLGAVLSTRYVITSDAAATGSPSFGSPVFNQTGFFSAPLLVVGGPTIPTPVMGQVNKLPAAAGITVSSPALGHPIISILRVLPSATALVTNHPTLTTTPVFGFASGTVLAANPFVTSSPVPGQPSVTTRYAISAFAFLTAGPVLDHPVLSKTGSGFSIPDVTIASPFIDAPVFSQNRALAANGLTTSSPNLSVVPSFATTTAISITAAGITTASPSIGNPNLISYRITPFVTGSPILSNPTLTTVYHPSASNFTVASPSIPTPTFTRAQVELVGNSLAIGSPVFGNPAVGTNYRFSQPPFAVMPNINAPPVIQNSDLLAAQDLIIGSLAISVPKIGTSVRATSLAVGSPSLPSLMPQQAHRLATTNINTGSPVLGHPFYGRYYNFSQPPFGVAPVIDIPGFAEGELHYAEDIIVGSPVIESPSTFTLRSNFASFAFAPASPVSGTPNLAVNYSFAANALATGSPAFGSATVQLTAICSAANLTIAAPTIPSLPISQNHKLAAVALSTTGPAISAATIAQIHALVIPSIAVSAPLLGQAGFNQNQNLIGTALVTTSPSIGVPSCIQNGANTAVPLTTGPPIFGQPSIGQGHQLAATSLEISSPELVNAEMGVIVHCAATAITTASPVLGAPTSIYVDTLSAAHLVTHSPSIAQASFGQQHGLTANDLAASLPQIGISTLNVAVVCVADNITVGAIELASTAIGQGHSFAIAKVNIASPSAGLVILDQITHAFLINAFATGHPILTRPPLILGKPRQDFVADSLSVNSPILPSPLLCSFPAHHWRGTNWKSGSLPTSRRMTGSLSVTARLRGSRTKTR